MLQGREAVRFCFAVFLLVFLKKRMVSLSSITAAGPTKGAPRRDFGSRRRGT